MRKQNSKIARTKQFEKFTQSSVNKMHGLINEVCLYQATKCDQIAALLVVTRRGGGGGV